MSSQGSGSGGGGAWMMPPGASRPPPSGNSAAVVPLNAGRGGSGPSMPPAQQAANQAITHTANAPAVAGPPPAHVVRALQQAQLFKNFTETGLNILAGIAQEKVLPLGTPLFVENMLGEALYVIVDGRIRISMRGPDGLERRLMLLEAGESLGEAALLRVGPRLCTATAETECHVLEIARRDVATLQRTKPQACLKLLMGVVELLGQRMRLADGEIRRLVAWRSGM